MTWLGRKRLCRQCRQWHQVAWRLQSSFAWSNTARVDTVSEIIIAAQSTATPPPPPTTLVNLLRAYQRAIFRHLRAAVPWVSCCWFFSCYCYFHCHFFHTTCVLLVAALTFTATSAAPSSHTVVQYGAYVQLLLLLLLSLLSLSVSSDAMLEMTTQHCYFHYYNCCRPL